VLLAGAVILVTAQSAAPLMEDVVGKMACDGQADCKIVEVFQAGTGANGEGLVVVEIGVADQSDGDRPCQPYRRDYYLVSDATPSDAKDGGIQKILSLCNDGYGASGVGEDDVEVSDNLLRHRQSGGSAWRWETIVTYELSPLRQTAQSSCSYHNVAPGFDAAEWNLKDFVLKGHRKRYACTEDGTENVDEDAFIGCTLDQGHSEFVAIPRVALELPKLTNGDLKLDETCAANVDSNGANGWVTFGAKSDQNDAVLRVLATDEKTIVISALDDRFVEKAESWLHADHFEVWIGPGEGGINCEDTAAKPTQWAILSSGEVIKAQGPDTSLPKVEMQRGNKTHEMLAIVRLPEKPARITVVYSDSDNGKSQERLIATSPLVFGNNETLGEIADVPAGAARCALRDGVISRMSWGEVKVLPVPGE
jgi:hypothetical protein